MCIPAPNSTILSGMGKNSLPGRCNLSHMHPAQPYRPYRPCICVCISTLSPLVHNEDVICRCVWLAPFTSLMIMQHSVSCSYFLPIIPVQNHPAYSHAPGSCREQPCPSEETHLAANSCCYKDSIRKGLSVSIRGTTETEHRWHSL